MFILSEKVDSEIFIQHKVITVNPNNFSWDPSTVIILTNKKLCEIYINTLLVLLKRYYTNTPLILC